MTVVQTIYDHLWSLVSCASLGIATALCYAVRNKCILQSDLRYFWLPPRRK